MKLTSKGTLINQISLCFPAITWHYREAMYYFYVGINARWYKSVYIMPTTWLSFLGPLYKPSHVIVSNSKLFIIRFLG